MNWIQLSTVARFKLFALFVPLMLLAAIACTPIEAELLEGILQNVDAVNGEITIVTKDGKTITLTIATDATVETEGANSALETLEHGSHVEVEVNEHGQVATYIKSHQAKIKGFIVPDGVVQVDEDTIEVTIETEHGHRRTITITRSTRIKLEDDFPGVLADLREGQEVEVKYDPETLVAFKVDTEEEEEAEIQGFIVPDGIVQVDDTLEVTIQTERGRLLTLVVGDLTRIELEEDFPGTVADLQVGAEVEAKFDPSTRTAFQIEVEEEEAAAIEGVVLKVAVNEVSTVN